MPAEETTPAIVLRTRDYAEADRIVTVLTRSGGKLSGIAKGAKHSRRRFERKLEVFSHVMLYFRRRLHGELVFITKAEAAQLPPFDLTDDLAKISLGSYMVELTDVLCREEGESSGAYALLVDSLGTLAHNGASRTLRQAFELKLLAWAGYQLEFSRCRICERQLGASITLFHFMPAHGGIVCQNCRNGSAEPSVGLSPASVGTLARLGAMPLPAAAEAEAAGLDAQAALMRFLATVLDRKLRSLELLNQIL